MPVAGAILVAALTAAGTGHRERVQAAMVVLEALCPLGTAMAVLSQLGRDPGIELVLSTPTSYRSVITLRTGLIVGVGVAATLLTAVGLWATGLLPSTVGAAGVIMIWAAPMVCLAGLGLFVGVATTSSAAASGAVGCLWLGEAILRGEFIENPALRPVYLFATVSRFPDGAWWANRAGLVATGAVALVAAGVVLRRAVRLLAKEAS